VLDLLTGYHAASGASGALWTTGLAVQNPGYDGCMKQAEQQVHVRIYKKEHGILRRLAFRKNTTIAAIIRLLIKEA
jgi:hypothetical protein